MKTIKKFLTLFFLICLSSGCDLFNKDESNNNGPLIEMAWLNDYGSISNGVTSNFLMVHKDGYEKAVFHDNYLVSIFDSPNEQSYSISFFDSTMAYVPSRIIHGDLEFVISSFNENTYTFDMSIIYPDFNNLKSANADKKVYQLFNQKFDPDTEYALLKLKKYIYGEDGIKGGLQFAGYVNTFRIAHSEGLKVKCINSFYDYLADQLDNPHALKAFNELRNSAEFIRLDKLNWKTDLLLGISESIIQNEVTDSDWFGKYGDQVSLLLNGGFTIATCAGTGGLGCAISVLSFAKDAYDLYQKTHPGLDGIWDRGSFEIRISGSSATFTDIKRGDYLIGKNAGLIPIGSECLRNITKIGNLEWTCSAIWLCINDGVAKEVGWTYSASITMSLNGDTIKVFRDLQGTQYCPGSNQTTSAYTRKKD